MSEIITEKNKLSERDRALNRAWNKAFVISTILAGVFGFAFSNSLVTMTLYNFNYTTGAMCGIIIVMFAIVLLVSALTLFNALHKRFSRNLEKTDTR